MRYLDKLIDQARRESENEEYSASVGIPQQEFIQWANDAQHRLQSKIVATHPQVFVYESTITAVADQESYDLPSDAFLGNKVTNVEYTDSDADNYYTLKNASLKRRASGVTGYPQFYIRRTGDILLAPAPQSAGIIRVNYVRGIRELDLRRAAVDEVTLASDSITSLSLAVTGTNWTTDRASLLEHEYVCIVDRYGSMKMKNIPFDAIDVATGNITVTSGFTFNAGETIAVGDYIVGGENTVTHSELPRVCERYLIQYMTSQALMRDSSIDVAEASALLSAMENDIIMSFSDVSDDVEYIPIIDEFQGWD